MMMKDMTCEELLLQYLEDSMVLYKTPIRKKRMIERKLNKIPKHRRWEVIVEILAYHKPMYTCLDLAYKHYEEKKNL